MMAGRGRLQIMNSPDKKKRNWKKIILEEMVEYCINAAYLGLVFAAFTQYRRFILAAYDISYTNYWVAAIEALILAKVIMIGAVLRLGRGLEQKPLIIPTLYRTFFFMLFVAFFKLIEHAIKGLWTGIGITGGVVAFFDEKSYEMLTNSLVLFTAFVPFFAFKEVERVFGVEKIRALFFRRRGSDESVQKGG
jgi:hypothetical protein